MFVVDLILSLLSENMWLVLIKYLDYWASSHDELNIDPTHHGCILRRDLLRYFLAELLDYKYRNWSANSEH